MPRSRFFRDPVHGQLRYDASLELAYPPPPAASAATDGDARLGWLVRRLVDCPEVQRLRHIRQNGLTNLVFHGAEHSRFSHSMGVAHLAREMYDRIVRNAGESSDPDVRLWTTVAALVHDVGHGPFSHTLEEILEHAGLSFEHETLTVRILMEPETALHRCLVAVDPQLPSILSGYIDSAYRRPGREHFSDKIVSSQLDADRLDYLLRDAQHAGLLGPSFDLPRILDLLGHLDGTRISVDRRALTAVEAYLVTLDHLYRTLYYHHTVRAADALLGATLRRGIELLRDGDAELFPRVGGAAHPLAELLRHGAAVPIATYLRLGEFHVWAAVEGWTHHRDPILADLAQRLLARRLPKTVEVDPNEYNKLKRLQKRVEELAISRLGVAPKDIGYYVMLDEPARTSYHRYDWRSGGADQSIWMVGGTSPPCPIEDEPQSSLVVGLKQTKYFHRLVFPAEIRDEVLAIRE